MSITLGVSVPWSHASALTVCTPRWVSTTAVHCHLLPALYPSMDSTALSKTWAPQGDKEKETEALRKPRAVKDLDTEEATPSSEAEPVAQRLSAEYREPHLRLRKQAWCAH